MSKIELLKSLIAKTEDPEELKKLHDQLIEAIREEERKKIEAEAAQKAKEAEDVEAIKAIEEGRKTSKLAKIPEGVVPKIEVGTPGLYKGVSLKAAVDTMQYDGQVSPAVRALAIATPEKAEKVCKWMVDLLDRAYKNPMAAEAIKGMTEGTTTAGGYLTPTEERLAVLSYIRDVSIAMQDCAHIRMTSDVMTIPAENSKVTVAYTNEATDATETTPSLSLVTLTAKRLDAYTKVTNELLGDAGNPGGVAGLLAGQFVEAIGQKVDSTVFIGTGSPVSGIFLSAGQSQVFGSGSTNFSELLESDIRNIVRKIRPSRRKNAKWYLATSILWQYVYGLKDGDQRPLFVETRGGGPGPGQLWGYPVREGNDDIMPSASAAATGFIAFGDLAGFMIGDRLTNVSLFVDPYSLSRSYQTQFLLFTRWAFAHALSNYYGRIVTHA